MLISIPPHIRSRGARFRAELFRGARALDRVADVDDLQITQAAYRLDVRDLAYPALTRRRDHERATASRTLAVEGRSRHETLRIGERTHEYCWS
jgi:hypothetical protein